MMHLDQINVDDLNVVTQLFVTELGFDIQEHGGHFIQLDLFGHCVVFMQRNASFFDLQFITMDQYQYFKTKQIFVKKNLAFNELIHHDDTCATSRMKLLYRGLHVEFVWHDIKDHRS